MSEAPMIFSAKSQVLFAKHSLCATIIPAAICTTGTALLFLALGPCIALLMKAHDSHEDLTLRLAGGATIALIVLVQIGSCGAGGFLVGRSQHRAWSISKDGRDRARGCLVWALGIFLGVFASLGASPLLTASETKMTLITSEQAVSSMAGHVVLASISDVDCAPCSRKDDSAGWLGQYLPVVPAKPATAVAAEQIASDRRADTGSTFSATLAASLIAGLSLSLSCIAACFCAVPGGLRKVSGPAASA